MVCVVREGDSVCVRDGGDVCWLTVEAAEKLASELLGVVADVRRGQIIDGVAWCVGCGRRTVNVEAGEDTCYECLHPCV
jgi:hypothetical protein